MCLSQAEKKLYCPHIKDVILFFYAEVTEMSFSYDADIFKISFFVFASSLAAFFFSLK